MTIGFGIIGCGMISRFHAKAIADIRGAKVVACYDAVYPAAEKYAADIGCTPYGFLSDMLADKKVDVVTICTPSGSHMEPACAAAWAGKHVIVEKPLEITLKRCDAIIRACQQKNVVLTTLFPSRFHESSQLMKKAIEDGRFGKLTMGDAYVKWWRTQQYYDSGAWRGTWELDGGGALMNQAIHSVDLLLWFMGPAVEVSAYTALVAHERIDVEDTVVAAVKFASGALGVLEASTATFPGELKRLEIHGNAGSAVLREEDLIVWKFAKETKGDESLRQRMASRTATGGGAADPKAIGHHGHTAQFQDTIDAIRKGKKPSIDGAEGRRAVELILAVYKSAETGKSVKLPLTSDPILKARARARKAKTAAKRA
jgi:predicted dehydrogenase